jgi:hypothetical protein
MNKPSSHIRLIDLFTFMAFLAQTFSSTLVLADYCANTTNADNCVDKAQRQTHCNGKRKGFWKARAPVFPGALTCPGEKTAPEWLFSFREMVRSNEN